MSNAPCLGSPPEEALRAAPDAHCALIGTGAPATHPRTLPVAAVVAVYVLLPMLFSQISARLLTLAPHGMINLEVVLIGAAAAFLPQRAVFCLVFVDCLAACAYSVCYTYQFLLPDLAHSARFLDDLPGARLADGMVVVLAAAVVSFALARVRPDRHRRVHAAVALACFGALLIPVDGLNGHDPFWHRDVLLMPNRVTSSPLVTLAVRELYAWRIAGKESDGGDRAMSSASEQLAAWVNGSGATGSEPNVVLVVVESWGLMLDPALEKAMLTPFDDASVTQRYDVKMGTAPFAGLTVPGEARELCGSAMGFGILHADAKIAPRCLPERLSARGYETIAIHGYAGQMFHRSTWYPELGFERAWFAQDLDRLNLPRCEGAFPGICDGAIADLIGDRLDDARDTRPKFIYWVTLNSHIPVPARPNLPDDTACSAQPALRTSIALCSWFRLVQAVHASMSGVAAKAEGRPTVFLLVGDHAPPFADPQLRAQFSGSVVPYVLLTPKAQVSH